MLYFSRIVNLLQISNAMSEVQKIMKEVIEFELAQLRMARKRAKDDSMRAMVIAQREVELESEIEKLEQGEAA